MHLESQGIQFLLRVKILINQKTWMLSLNNYIFLFLSDKQ